MTATTGSSHRRYFQGWEANTATVVDSEHISGHEDEAWQDELEGVESPAQTSERTDHGSARNVRVGATSSPRRRKAPIGINMRRDRKSSQSRISTTRSTTTPMTHRQPSTTSKTVAVHAENGAVFILHYCLDILKSVIMMLKTPLKIVVFFWLLSFLGDRIFLEVRKTVSPFCWIPGINLSAVCRSVDSGPNDHKTKWADFERLEDTQVQAFHAILVESFGNSALALDIKRAEMATSDLASLVRVSDLRMKKPIEDQLRGFGKLAAMTADGLQTMAAKVNGAFDRIIAINDHAMATIEQARNKELAPWSLAALMRPKEGMQDVINTVFDQALAVLAFNLRDLIIVAELNLARLRELEGSLATLHGFATDSKVQTSADKEQVLGEIWTWLGGNRDELRVFDDNLGLLRHVGEYRRQALAHVVAARQALLNMQATMEDMRQRAADPLLMGPAIPVEVHINSIRMALARMEKSRLLARQVEEKAYNREYAKL